jgi:hypothetical protein
VNSPSIRRSTEEKAGTEVLPPKVGAVMLWELVMVRSRESYVVLVVAVGLWIVLKHVDSFVVSERTILVYDSSAAH